MAHGRGLSKGSLHSGPNMTPMVDIVMCILIFFMLTMSFASSELFLPNSTPVTERGLSNEKPAGEKVAPSVQNKIELKLVNGQLKAFWVGGGEIIEGIDTPKDNRLWHFLKDRQSKMSKEVQIIIVPEPGVRYKDVITVYDACMKAEFAHVGFQAARNPEAR